MMDQMKDEASWKTMSSLEDATHLVDLGVLLTWKDFKVLRKVLKDEELVDLVVYAASRLSERVESRLPAEILTESLLIIFANIQEENVLEAFLQEVLNQPNRIATCSMLVELALTADVSDADKADEIFSIAVALVCELGTMIRQMQISEPEELGTQGQKLLDHISTYLLSVSNSSDNCIRLSLLHYFGSLEKGKTHKVGFNRIMGRFGHTVLEHLFVLLFNKKTESVALQYLLENVPYILEADDHAQTILQETWKHYLLKKPERFALFVQALSAHILSLPEEDSRQCRKTFMQHLALLTKKVAEVDHKELGRQLLSALAGFQGEPFFREIVGRLAKDLTLRDSFRSLVVKMHDASNSGNVVGDAEGFRSSKRGRRPSFQKSGKTRIMYQIRFLGQQSVQKAG
ncbi:MAG: hypothetical protein EOP10_19945 [Proteobacteria bacterium]|nr:MAG: hypothetical protein EOP10_19945 [Pseudomonadota bacterium]